MLVRTWNVFHGNADPPVPRAFLREMVELVSADAPDVVCLQELPLWAFSRLAEWSGMQAVSAVARRPLLWSAALGKWITELNHGLFRSAFTGEGDAILVAKRFRLSGEQRVVVSDDSFTRIAHCVVLDGRLAVVNFHITGRESQWRRVGQFAQQWEHVVVAGDANIRGASLPGYSQPLAGSIDQILVRGVPATPP